MGYLRTYLALCVVAAHSGAIFPWAMHDGIQAVQIFFLISGFYMAMVLSGKYETRRDFYVSRWLRIFGPYYVVLLAVVLWSAVVGWLYGDWLALRAYADHPLLVNGLLGVVFAALTNLTLFGQDWVMFLKHEAGQPLMPTRDFFTNKAPLYRYLLIPQCWSVGIEETFYLLAPFIARAKTALLIVALLLSVAARLVAYRLFDLERGPWVYRFSPFEIALFLLGVLAYRAYRRFDLQNRIPACPNYPVAVVILTAAFALHARAVEILSARIGFYYVVLLSYPVWAVVVPVLFAAFREHRADRFVGELCYPVYLIHLIVVSSLKGIGAPYIGVTSAGVTLALSAMLYYVALRPYERWRHRYVKQRATGGAQRGSEVTPLQAPSPA